MTDWIAYYLTVHILLGFSYGLLCLVQRIPMPAIRRLNMSYWLVATSFLAPCLFALQPAESNPFGPVVKVWNEPTSSSELTTPSVFVKAAPQIPTQEVPLDFVMIAVILAVTFMLYRGHYLIHEYLQLRNFLKSVPVLKRFRRQNLVIIQADSSPFSFFDGTYYVALPPGINREQRKIALAHELQHHRQGDTWMVYPLALVLWGWGFNPLVSRLTQKIEDYQELACDEALVGRKTFTSRAYLRCLLDIAQSQLATQPALTGAVGMAMNADQLKRRIQHMLKQQKTNALWVTVLATLLGSGLLSTTAWALSGTVGHQSLNLRQAQYLAAKSQLDIPIRVDNQVLYWLNHSLATQESRQYLKSAMDRMKSYEPMIIQKLRAANMPEELLAVPLVESGFVNSARSSAGALGIWQFMPQTARRCGLDVSQQVDERLNATLLTDAAVCYYRKLQAAFQDWHLSIAAYNSGEHRVLSAITNAEHNNALRLAEDGYLPDETARYLPKVIAAMIILKNPDLLD